MKHSKGDIVSHFVGSAVLVYIVTLVVLTTGHMSANVRAGIVAVIVALGITLNEYMPKKED